MKRLGFAPQARADLLEIAQFIAQDNPLRAASFIEELEQRAQAAAASPRLFTPRDDLAPGLRATRHGRYLLLFRELDDEVRTVRVLHGAQDLRRLLAG